MIELVSVQKSFKQTSQHSLYKLQTSLHVLSQVFQENSFTIYESDWWDVKKNKTSLINIMASKKQVLINLKQEIKLVKLKKGF